MAESPPSDAAAAAAANVDAAYATAVSFLRDALEKRNPNKRLAAMAGLGGQREEAAHRRPVQLFLRSAGWRLLLQAVVAAHCCTIFWHNVPPSSQTPPFSWGPGVAEGVFLAVYGADAALSLVALGGIGAFLKKRWQVVFTAVAVMSVADWLAYYPGGA